MTDLPKAKERGKPKQEVRLAKWMQKLSEEGVSHNFRTSFSFLIMMCLAYRWRWAIR